jgi:hypothetical protein
MASCIPADARRWLVATTLALASLALAAVALAAPKVVMISLDGATPRFVEQFLDQGVLDDNEGLGLLRRRGVTARQNVTINPSLTAPAHIAIATGSIAAALRDHSEDVVAFDFTRSAATSRASRAAPRRGPSRPLTGSAARLGARSATR